MENNPDQKSKSAYVCLYIMKHLDISANLLCKGANIVTQCKGARCICFLCICPIPMLLLWTTQVLPL